MSNRKKLDFFKFQSTLSVRRATGGLSELLVHIRISIHALRKESDADRRRGKTHHGISIHALRKESDDNATKKTKTASSFQSTLSVRRATC